MSRMSLGHVMVEVPTSHASHLRYYFTDLDTFHLFCYLGQLLISVSYRVQVKREGAASASLDITRLAAFKTCTPEAGAGTREKSHGTGNNGASPPLCGRPRSSVQLDNGTKRTGSTRRRPTWSAIGTVRVPQFIGHSRVSLCRYYSDDRPSQWATK
jgi:hypothetical protein